MNYNDNKTRPESIENRWDILYRDYPEIYDEFASQPYEPRIIDVLIGKFDFSGKIVLDIGSGSGLSTFPIAKMAKEVIGVEPETAIRELAIKNAEERGIGNIKFIDGRAEKIPMPDDSVDIVMAITATLFPPQEAIPKFIKEARRVAKPGGQIIAVDITPGWYGGHLAKVIGDEDADVESWKKHDIYLNAGFEFEDIEQVQDYGNLEKILATYGFIFGRKAIKHIRENDITKITWRFRVWSYTVQAGI